MLEEFLRLENKSSWLLTAAAVDRVSLFFELLPWVPTLYSMTQRGLDDICTQSVVRQSWGTQSQSTRIFYNRLLFAPETESLTYWNKSRPALWKTLSLSSTAGNKPVIWETQCVPMVLLYKYSWKDSSEQKGSQSFPRFADM